jgi:lipid-binding SYLF domain-containing protein
MKKLLLTILVTGVAYSAPVFAGAREEARLIEAAGVLEELFAQRDTAIPDRLMARAYGIAVVPNVVKVGAVVGGRRGSGAMVVRDASGKFCDPIMISLTGGSIGWQIGVQSNRGLFAGVSLDGSVIAIDRKSNSRLYGRTAPAADIIAGTIKTDAPEAKRFERAIATSTASSRVAAQGGNTATSAPDAIATPADTAAPPPAGATTFPMEDNQPGAEPPR